MAQVPYTGVPTVSPSERGLEVSTLPAAFGVETSQALGGLGKALTDASGELWQRATALQAMKNETRAKDASINFMIELGERHARFNALEGEARVNDFQNYSRDMKEIYSRHRNTLDNEQAQNMFDSSAVPALRQSIFNGAGASATALKEWSHSTDVSTLKNLQNDAYTNPASDLEHKQREDKIPGLARNLATTSPGGWSEAREHQITAEATSQLWVDRVKGIERASPFAAIEMMNANRKKFTNPDWLALNKEVESAVLGSGADDLALKKLNQYRMKDGTYSKEYKEMQDELRDEVTTQWGDKFPLLAKAAVSQLENHWYRDDQAKKLDASNFRKTIQDYIVENKVTTISQLPPDMVKKMGGPTNTVQKLQVQGWINLANSQQNAVTKKQIFDDLTAMYNNRNEKFMTLDLMSVPGMDRTNFGYFRRLQREGKGGDVRVQAVMKQMQGLLGQELESLGVYSREKGNPENYDRLTAAVSAATQAYLEANHKMPDNKAIKEQIWPAVKADVKEFSLLRPFSGFSVNTPFFKAAIPDEAREAMEKDDVATGRKPRNEFEMQRDYNMNMMLKHFGVKDKE